MRHVSARPIHGRASASRRIALFLLVIIALITVIASQSPATKVAGAEESTIYMPLIANSDGSTAAATAPATTTATANPTEISTATATMPTDATATETATATVTATATATATVTAVPTIGTPQPPNVTGTVYLRPRFALTDAGQCVPGGGTNWVNIIDSAHIITNTSQRNLFGLPADTSVYGYVFLSDAYGRILQTAPIQSDALTGALSYTFPHLMAGPYYQTAYVAYNGDDQPTPIARLYSLVMINGLPVPSRSIIIGPGAPGSVVTLDPLFLDLRDDVCSAL